MILENIFVFVLALVAFGCVALGWTIFDLKRQMRDAESSRSTTVSGCVESLRRLTATLKEHGAKLAELEAQSPVELGTRVVELSEAVERLRRTHQRFAGRVSQELSQQDQDAAQVEVVDRNELRRAHAKEIMPAGLKR